MRSFLPLTRERLAIPLTPPRQFAQQVAAATTMEELQEIRRGLVCEREDVNLIGIIDRKIASLAESVHECRSIYLRTTNPEAKSVAYNKYEQLIDAQVPNAGLDELRGLLGENLADSSQVRKKIIDLIDGILGPKLETAQTIEDVTKVWRMAPTNGTVLGRAQSKLEQILDEKLRTTTTIDECLCLVGTNDPTEVQTKVWARVLQLDLSIKEWLGVFSTACPKGFKFEIAEKIFSKAETIDELWSAYGIGFGKGLKEKSKAFKMRVLRKIVETTDDPKTLWSTLGKFQKTVPAGIDLQQEVFSKLIQFGGKEDLERICLEQWLAPTNSRSKAAEALIRFYLLELDETSTVFKCWQLYNKLPAETVMGSLRDKITDKIEALLEERVVVATSVEECQKILDMSPLNSSVALMASKKMERLRRQSQ